MSFPAMTVSGRFVVTVAVAAVVSTTAACGGSTSGGSSSSGSSGMSGEQAYQQIRQGGSVDYNSLNCPALKFLADKYQSIGDSAGRLTGDSPAATASQMTAIQAWNKSSQLNGLYARRC